MTATRDLPVFDEQLVVRWRIGTLLAVVGALVSGVIGLAIFLTTLYVKVDTMQTDMRDVKDQLRQFLHVSVKP